MAIKRKQREHREFLEAIGTNTDIAKLFLPDDVPEETLKSFGNKVSMWKARDSIPKDYMFELGFEGIMREITVPNDVKLEFQRQIFNRHKSGVRR